MKRALLVIAMLYLPALGVEAVLEVLRHQSPGSAALAPNALIPACVSVVRALVVVGCWGGSIYVWLQKDGKGVGRVFSLLGLAIFGIVAGPFYILLNAKYLGPAAENSAA